MLQCPAHTSADYVFEIGVKMKQLELETVLDFSRWMYVERNRLSAGLASFEDLRDK